jgi:hypothetical protein
MANLILETETEQSLEARVFHVGEQAIPFERFLDMVNGQDMELVQGVIVEKPMIQLDHERCSRWLYQVAGPYVQERGLGEMLSSRIMVKTNTFDGRIPDLPAGSDFAGRMAAARTPSQRPYNTERSVFELICPAFKNTTPACNFSQAGVGLLYRI